MWTTINGSRFFFVISSFDPRSRSLNFSRERLIVLGWVPYLARRRESCSRWQLHWSVEIAQTKDRALAIFHAPLDDQDGRLLAAWHIDVHEDARG
jgi:hypothetical protein